MRKPTLLDLIKDDSGRRITEMVRSFGPLPPVDNPTISTETGR